MPYPKKANEAMDTALGALEEHKIKVLMAIPEKVEPIYREMRRAWLTELLNYHQQLNRMHRGILHRMLGRYMRPDLRETYIVDIQKKLARLRAAYYDPEARLLRNLKGYK